MNHVKRIKSTIAMLGLLLLLPVLNSSQSGAIFVSNSYDVYPLDYEINVQVGDTRVYIMDHISQGYIDEYGLMLELNEMQMPMMFNGTEENITINEGTVINAEVMEITNESIRVKVEYCTLDGPTYYPDDLVVNRSNLELIDEKNVARLIMTTNHSLIDSVFQGSEWNYELHEDRMRFTTEIWNETYNSWQEIEYDGYSGFLRHLSLNFNFDEGWFSMSLHETFFSDPNEYSLGVMPGDKMFYTISKISFWDEGMNMYHDDFPTTILQNGEYHNVLIREGDSFELEVVETEGVYLKLKATFYTQESNFQDESLIILDKSTGYFSSAINPGYMPPILITTNQNILGRFLHMNYKIENGEVVFSDSWDDPGNNWKQSEKGIWNVTTGWMKYYSREEYQNNKLTHEFEIVTQEYNATDNDTTPEFPIGVAPGDSNVLEFKTIALRDENGTISDTLYLDVGINGGTRTISLQPGDTMEIVVKDVADSKITIFMKINSTTDGSIETDPWTMDLSYPQENQNEAPPFIVPTEFEKIKTVFGEKAEVTQSNDEFHVKVSYDKDNNIFIDEYVYDASSGWVLSMKQSIMVDGEPQLMIFVESLGYTESVNESDNNSSPTLELTPVPLWPSVLFLLIASLVYRRKRI
ncbi:MAG: hypothetical protein ACTSW1_09300 [Candidatus Hodarchaeales archaeon]